MNRKLIASAALAVALGMSGAAFANKTTAPGQNKVCLITFANHADAVAGADITILAVKYLPLKAAQQQQTFTTGGSVRIFDYSSSPGVANNADERALCRGLSPS